MKQTRIQRSRRTSGGRGEPTPDLLVPTTPASDTRPAAAALARIDAALTTS